MVIGGLPRSPEGEDVWFKNHSYCEKEEGAWVEVAMGEPGRCEFRSQLPLGG